MMKVGAEVELIDYSKSNPFEMQLRFIGEACHGIFTAFCPTTELADAAFHATSAAIQDEILPAALAVDALRTTSSFMADSWHIGEHTLRTGVDIMGEIAGGLTGHAIGLSLGEMVGASIGSLVAGPLGSITGAGLGGAVGSISASFGGSFIGGTVGGCLAEQLNVFARRSKSSAPANSTK
jgi:hypothetical protein